MTSLELQPSASYSLTLRLELSTRPGTLGRVTMAIGQEGGDIDAIDIVRTGGGVIVRDITVACRDDARGEAIDRGLESVEGVKVLHVTDRTFLVHLGGKIEVNGRVPVKTRDDLSMVYTPGVARVCLAIRDDPAKQWDLTVKRHMVAVVTDGSAVLGLGNIGPAAAQPVMEGKCMRFKKLCRRGRLPDLPGYPGPRRDRRDGRAHRARLRRHQPGGHRRAQVLRHRGSPAQDPGHPGYAR